jgi:hypothetical protein
MFKSSLLPQFGVIAFFLLFTLLAVTAKAQLKVGENPTSIHKSSVLELESTRQGLLLPRLSDTASINLLSPPNGMLIYLTADNSLRIRSAGSWKKLANMAEASANWALQGNTGIDSASNFIGNKDAQPLTFKTNDAARMIISSDGKVGIGTTTPDATLNVNGTVKFENLGNGSTEVDVLVLNADGSVYKRTMPSTVFDNALKAINGIQTATLSITANASTNYDSVAVASTTADSTIAIHLPVQDGQSGATKPYGLLTFSEWEKINATILNIQNGAVSTQSHANGITIDSTANTRTIILHPADAANPGIVTAGAQTFGGSKTFQDSVTLGGPLMLNTLSSNTSSDTVLVLNNGVIEKRQVSEAAFGNAIRSMNNLRDTAQAIALTTNGTDLTVSTNGADSIFLNVPNAGAAARGVVSVDAQTFGGNKTFQDSITAAATFKVGASGTANSTVQVAGSLAMAIRTVTADATISDTDNTVLANTTTSGIVLTLPNPAGMTGRIYTIKKIGTGGIDNDLTITPTSATIDGGSSYKIYNDWTYVTLQTDGTDWYIIKK